jgi:hypothetical protein
MKHHDVSSIACSSAAVVRMVQLGDIDVDCSGTVFRVVNLLPCRRNKHRPTPSAKPATVKHGTSSLGEECDAGSMFGSLRRPSLPTAEGMTRSESSYRRPSGKGSHPRGSAPSSAGGRGHVELLLGLLRLGLGAEGLGLDTSPWRSGRQERTRLGRQRYP